MAGLDGMQAIMSPAARVWRVPYLQLAILRYSTPRTVANVARCSQQTFQAAVRVLYHHMDAHQLDLIMRICSIGNKVQYAAAVCELSQVQVRHIVDLVIKHPRLCRLNFALPENYCRGRVVLKRDDWEHVSAEVVIYGSRLWVRGTVRDDSDDFDMEECLWCLPKYWNTTIRVAIATSDSGFDDRTNICSYPISDLCVSEPGYDKIEAALDRLTENDTLMRIIIDPAEYGSRRATLSNTLRLIMQRGTPDIGFRLYNAQVPDALRAIAQNIDTIRSSFRSVIFYIDELTSVPNLDLLEDVLQTAFETRSPSAHGLDRTRGGPREVGLIIQTEARAGIRKLCGPQAQSLALRSIAVASRIMAALGGPCANYLFEIRDAESDVTAPPFMSGLMEEIYRSMLRSAIEKHLEADRPDQIIGWRRMERLNRA